MELKLFAISNGSLTVPPALNGSPCMDRLCEEGGIARPRVLLCPVGGASDGTKPRHVSENQKMPLTAHRLYLGEDCGRESLLCWGGAWCGGE